ncbi:MAG: ASPIC/UnbV domain-containing protein, partial [Acidobacteriota bacterium]
TFTDITWTAGANPPGWFWGSGWADFDNDGWQDLYSANGWVYNQPGTELELDFLSSVVGEQDVYKTGALFDPAHFGDTSWHGWERNRHLRSQGLGPDGIVRYEEIGRATGTDLLLNSRGTAFADFWNRGVVDIAVAASTDRHALLRNTVGSRRAWLQVELVGGAGRLADGTNRDAVGARVEVRHAGSTQLREVALGDGYGSQSSLRQHFGLGVDTSSEGTGELRVDELLVTWPRSGRVERFIDVPANRIVEIVEGEGAWSEKVYRASISTAISP